MKDPLTELFSGAYKAKMTERRQHIKRDSLGRRTDRVKKREAAAMLHLQLSGLTPGEIAVKLGRKVETVKRHLPAESMEKVVQQSKVAQVVPGGLFSEIRKLAQRLEQLTYVPEPRRAFLPDSHQAETNIVDAVIKGRSESFYSTMILGMRTPWWCATGPVEVRRHLTWEQQALLDRFIGLPSSQRFKAALATWEKKVNTYIQLKRFNTNAEEIQAAYFEAHAAMIAVNSELWAAIEIFRWSS